MPRTLSIPAAGAILALLALALPARGGAEDLLPNGSFDAIVSPWSLDSYSATFASFGWSPVDLNDSSSSGSLTIANQSSDKIDFAWARTCLPAEEGETYRFGFESLVPAGQSPSGDVSSSIRFYTNGNCSEPAVLWENGRRVREVGSWEATEVGPVAAPAGTQSLLISVGVRKTEALPGAVTANFDAAYLLAGDDAPAPEPPPEGWFTDPTFPGFRFNVLITAGESSRTGNPEPTCLPETICVSGALPGRVEIFLRIVGPKPNGYLWPTLFKASTSRFDVWIEQKGTDVIKHYVLDAAEPGGSELPGYFDREGFLP